MVSHSYLHQDHGRDFLGGESLGFSKILDLDDRVATLIDNLEWPRLDVLLDDGILVPPANKTPGFMNEEKLILPFFRLDSLDVKDSVLRVHSRLVLCGLTDQALLVGEGYKGRSCVATLLVGN